MPCVPLHACRVIAIALVAAGCGGDDDDNGNSFKEDYLAQSGKIDGIGNDVGAAIQASSGQTNTEIADAFNDLAIRTKTAVSALQRLDPPDDLADERDALAKALQRGQADLQRVAQAANDGDVDAFRAAGSALSEGAPAIRTAREELDKLAKQA
jgi:hypothetical protein